MSILSLLIIPLYGILNRVRGGGFYGHLLPGHPRVWISVFTICLSLFFLPIYQAAFLGACFFLWSLLPWGRWYSLGNMPREASGNPDFFEKIIEKSVDSLTTNRELSDNICFFIRNLICLIPLLIFYTIPGLIV